MAATENDEVSSDEYESPEWDFSLWVCGTLDGVDRYILRLIMGRLKGSIQYVNNVTITQWEKAIVIYKKAQEKGFAKQDSIHLARKYIRKIGGTIPSDVRKDSILC